MTVVVAARRGPIGTAGRGLRALLAHELAAPVLRAVHDDAGRAGLLGPAGAWLAPDDVVLGNCTGPGGNLARVSALAAGLGTGVPGLTVDRQCGSGLAAILAAHQAIAAGDMTYVLAGGVESASTAPDRAHRPGAAPSRDNTTPEPYARAPFAPPGFPDPDMGPAADALAAARSIGRERQDAYAASSHAKALASHAAGRFDRELVAVGDLRRDDRPRRLDPAVLARMRPAFTPGGSVTAATASPISDGACALALLSDAVWAGSGGPDRERAPGLRIVAGAVVGSDPALPGWGAVPAIEAALERSGHGVGDLAMIEIVEAFAAQVLAATDALGLDPLGADADRVCPDGGALALGHPWGASGAVAVTRLFSRLVAGGFPTGTRGLAAAAVGGGMGIALVVEVVR
ncbi:acetyl-CoA C-acetyltransferase [Sanguibacter gelidistatuariae]|uniref:Acetyl-CoA C-acetyltransferase n=1 Tax=Sanguibacter gelidistatuariae TaxID=1814289 RepID=A0A1G6N4X7_9MICO|nr:thiolase family protein [Sanguibacter gelidistatuariae]SDC62286.1 acetyl-CoA C-acetyltransferase [Sanguibacter gelidistatuariae]